jgi:hypothetical protein
MKLLFATVFAGLVGSVGLMMAGSPAAEAATSAGKIVTETRAVSDFEAIAQSGSIDIVVRQGASEGVEVQAEDTLLPLIETVVEPGSAGRTLNIRIKRGEHIYSRKPIKVTVNVIRLTSVATAGSGDVVIEALKTPSLKLALAGASDARLHSLATDSFEIRISGSGDVAASGNARQLKLSIAGSGDADLADLAADDVSVRIAGSGDAKVTANKALEVSVAGSGDVSYGGAVTAVKTSVAGSGSIQRR